MAFSADHNALRLQLSLLRSWESGTRLRVEELISNTNGDTTAVVLPLIQLEMTLRLSAGESVERTEYRERFPHLADRVDAMFEGDLQQLSAGELSATDSMPAPAPVDDADSETVVFSGPAGSTSADWRPGGDYEDLIEIGRGGMGIVYRARHRQLDRLVALKMIRGSTTATHQEIERFQREARAIAKLNHDGIVKVFDVGRRNGETFIVLEHIAGGSLRDRLAGTSLPPREAAALLVKLAQAMATAHAAGIVHRDLKPANILMTEAGEPKITDFGLAKQNDDAGETTAGAPLGTPSYMAPEQARGASSATDARADVYALGAVLYECLTGRPPFKAENVLETVQQVIATPPVAPSVLQPKIPRDIETICLKCLEKDPDRRYRSASDLEEELQRFLAGRPIVARPVSRVERAWRWGKRNPIVSGLLALTIASIVVGGILVTQFAFDAHYQAGLAEERAGEADRANDKAQKSASRATRQKLAAEKQADRNSRLRYASQARVAWEHVINNDMTVARHVLRGMRWDTRGPEYGLMLSMFDRHVAEFPPEKNQVWAVDFSPDGKHVASAAGEVSIRDRRSGKLIRKLPMNGQQVRYSPDGKTLLVANSEVNKANFTVWLVETSGKVVWTKALPGRTCSGVLFHPDGRRIVVAHRGAITIHQRTDGALLDTIRDDKNWGIQCIGVNRDGTQIAAGLERLSVVGSQPVYHGRVRVWNLADKQTVREMAAPGIGVRSVDFHPDGKFLTAAGSAPGRREKIGSVYLWDVGKGKEIWMKDLPGVSSARFLAGGEQIATAGADRQLRIWDAGTGNSLRVFRGPKNHIASMGISRDERFIAIGLGGIYGKTQHVQVFDLKEIPARFRTKTRAAALHHVRFSPNGKQVATSFRGQGVTLWDVTDGTKIRTFGSNRIHGVLSAADFTPDGKFIGVPMEHAAGRAVVRVFDLEGKLHREAQMPGNMVEQFVMANRSFAMMIDGHRLQVWNHQSEKPAMLFEQSVMMPRALQMSPDETLVAVASFSPKPRGFLVTIWNVATKKEVCSFHTGTGPSVPAMQFSRDGRTLYASSDADIEARETATGRLQRRFLGHPGEVSHLQLNRAGTRLLSAGKGGRVKLWDATTGEELVPLWAGESNLKALRFSTAEDRILVADSKNIVRGWNIVRRTYPREIDLGKPIRSAVFSQTGREIIVRTEDGESVFNATTGEPIAEPAETMRAGKLGRLTFSGAVLRWDY